jgi:hypothetical protein
MASQNQDPRLLSSVTQAKAADVEARLIQHISTHPAVAPALSYASTSATVTQAVNGTFTWTPPAGVTSAKIECWGAGAGGNGGNTINGGYGGGGGEYACEPAYPVVPGQAYTYVVGNGGSGGTTGNPGQDGSDTIFDADNAGGLAWLGGVFAGGATAFHGGTGSLNTIAYDGGDAGGSTANGGGGGGGSGGSAGPGGTGGSTSVGVGGTGGAAGAGGGAAGGTGGSNASAGFSGSAPGGGGGAAGASTSATSGSNQYRLSGSATYRGSDASGGAANTKRADAGGTMNQGGTTASGGSYNGTQKALGIIGGNPQGDLSGKTIDSVSIRLEWLHCWYNNGAYVILGYTGFSALGPTWGGSGITGVKTWWQGPATDQGGGPKTTDLTGQGFGTALQNGSAQSISLGPGGGYNLNNYGQAYGAGGDNGQNPLITVTWHTGTAPVRAGDGRDGQVTITYTISGILQSALQPSAGADAGGNAFAAGYTGPVTAIQPASSPSAVETWHAFPAFATNYSHGSPNPSYKLNADNTVSFTGQVNVTSGAAGATFVTLPASAYWPVSTKKFAVAISAGTPSATANVQVTINTAGAVILSAPPTGAGYTFSLDGIRYPLDI